MSVPKRLAGLASSKIRDNMRIAGEMGAINLAQGRPDFPPPPEILEAAVDAIRAGHNQYSITWGDLELREAVSAMLARRFGLKADPETEITITCGVTEAIVAAILATVDDGDEVLILEPAHENYVPAVLFAGGVPRYVALRNPDFHLDLDELQAAVTSRTRVLILNTPHNPSGRVFTLEEQEGIARIASSNDIIVLTDEIYDHILYEGRRHIPPATVPGLEDRTITTGGLSKIFAVTGWRLGYVVAPRQISESIRMVHDYLTICAPSPLQRAAIVALSLPEPYFDQIRAEFTRRRQRLMDILNRCGFRASPPEGAYYVMADFTPWGFSGDSDSFTRWLISNAGVALVPGSAFYCGHPELGRSLVRFAFALNTETLDRVGHCLEKVRPMPGERDRIEE